MTYYLLLLIFPMLLGLWAQHRVRSAFQRFSQVGTASRMTGAQTATTILQAAGITDVQVRETDGFLGDHYDPTSKTLCLSSGVYGSESVAAVGIAAHECGHAIQHARAYAPLHARMAVVPVTQIASNILPFICFGGMVMDFMQITLKVIVACYVVLTVFQLITLPVEFDATRRAKIILGQMGIIRPGEETMGVNRVLDAAALTYVAAFVAALGNLLYFMMLSNRRR